jgi:hypothetical protein
LRTSTMIGKPLCNVLKNKPNWRRARLNNALI